MSNIKHGFSRTKPYKAWTDMKYRCYNPNKKEYEHYGGRGITVCDSWLNSFENFWNDMGKDYREELSLDRIDNNGNYCPENCRWTDKKTQARNRRVSRMLQTPFGEMCISELAEKAGLTHHLIQNRLKMGWDISRIILPVKSKVICDECKRK